MKRSFGYCESITLVGTWDGVVLGKGHIHLRGQEALIGNKTWLIVCSIVFRS